MKKKKQQLPHGFLIEGKIPLVEVPLKEVPARLYNTLKDKDFDLKTNLDKYEKEVIVKEENKYYVPEIEEFHVGFELEGHIVDKDIDEWRPFIIKYPNYDWMDTTVIDNIKIYSVPKSVRVKYLDKEDIESLGWKCVKEYSTKQIFQSEIKEEDDFEYWFELDKYLQTKWIEISVWKSKNNLSNEKLIFEGIIKNKSEFKTLLRQLNISK